jgi:hypothetical protein
MRLLLLGDDGTVIDSTDEFTREEFGAALANPVGAVSLLADLNPDAR